MSAGHVPAGDPGSFDPYAGGEPSEEQMQQMLAQMRVLPIDQHLAQVFQLMLEGAQVKVGRNDGRLLLDVTAVMAEQVRPYADADLIGQVDEGLAQLRMAQVQAESQLQRAAVEEGHVEDNDLPTPPRVGGPGAPAPDGDQGDGAVRPTPPPAAPRPPAGPKLWTPGM